MQSSLILLNSFLSILQCNELIYVYFISNNLKTIAQHLQTTNQKSLNTLADIGSNILCEAYVPDVTRLNVDVGLNIHVEMTLPEIVKFVDAKKRQLDSKSAMIQQKINKVQTDIQIVCFCIIYYMYSI